MISPYQGPWPCPTCGCETSLSFGVPDNADEQVRALVLAAREYLRAKNAAPFNAETVQDVLVAKSTLDAALAPFSHIKEEA